MTPEYPKSDLRVHPSLLIYNVWNELDNYKRMKIDFLQLPLHLLKISKHYRLQPYMFGYKILNLWILFQPLILNIQTLWIKTLGVWLYDFKALDHLVSNLERSHYYIIHEHQRTHSILFYFAYTLNTLLLSLRASDNP